MIQLKDLRLSYGDNVILDNISYNFNRNRIYGLVGQNGVGKTTFLNCIARVNQTCSGLITCDERSIEKLSYIDTDIILVNSDKVFFEHLTVYEHFKLLSLYLKKDNKFVENTIEKFNLNEYRNMLPEQLSLGTVHRLMLGMLLSQGHKYILADEPFNGLDVVQCQELVKLLLKYKQEDACIIISSHILDPLKGVCDEILLLKQGKLYTMAEDDIVSYETLNERLCQDE